MCHLGRGLSSGTQSAAARLGPPTPVSVPAWTLPVPHLMYGSWRSDGVAAANGR